MDIGGSYILESFMILHRLWNQKELILRISLMDKMKRLTIPCLGKDVEQLNCLVVFYKVNIFLPKKNVHGRVIQNSLKLETT